MYLLFQFLWSMKLLPSEKFSTSTFPKESLIRPKQLLNNLQTIMHDPGPRGHPKGGGAMRPDLQRTQALGSERPGLNPDFSTHHLCDPGFLIKCPAQGGGENRGDRNGKCLVPGRCSIDLTSGLLQRPLSCLPLPRQLPSTPTPPLISSHPPLIPSTFTPTLLPGA